MALYKLQIKYDSHSEVVNIAIILANHTLPKTENQSPMLHLKKFALQSL